MINNELEQRIEALEHRYQRLKILWAVSLILLAGAYPAFDVISNTSILHGVVRSKQFVVEGSHGKPYARLDSAGLHLYNEKGREVVHLAAMTPPEASGKCLWKHWVSGSEKSPPHTSISCPKSRLTDPRLRLSYNNGATLAYLGNNKEFSARSPVLNLNSRILPNGNSVNAILSGNELLLGGYKAHTYIDSGSITLARGHNGSSISLETDKLFGGPFIKIKNRKGRDRVVIGRSTLIDTRTNSTTQRSASSIVLFDKKGRVLWEIPGN